MHQSTVSARRPSATSRPSGSARPPVLPLLPVRLSSLFLPPDCVGCGQRGAVVCRRCRFGLLATSAVVVDTGGEPVYAAAPFAGTVRDIVTGLKYRNRRDAARVLARLIAERIDLGPVDLVTWAPTTDHRARHRGFDQAELVARELGRMLGVPSRRLLFRRHGPTQTGRSRAERVALDHRAAFRGHARRPGLRVVVVDDVVTTGSTLRAARESLWAAGAAEVVCVAAAATPPASPPDRTSPAGLRRGDVGLTPPEGRHR